MTREALDAAVTRGLQSAGDPGPWRRERYLGGSQSDVVLVRTPRRAYVLKTGMPGPMAAAEARGLELLRASGAVRVPDVIACGQDPAFVLLEHVAGAAPAADDVLGRQLAELHAVRSDRYGLDHDNFIGRTPQRNTPRATWVEFYRDCRLAPQIELAARQGRLPPRRRRASERVLSGLEGLVDESATVPSLIHGDLWSGNVIAGPGGEPVLIDPAVSYSDREAELSMTRLFGGFSRRFYDAYEAAWPLDPGWRDRDPLYRLYHLLNHLNLFGEGYGSAVDAALARLVP